MYANGFQYTKLVLTKNFTKNYVFFNLKFLNLKKNCILLVMVLEKSSNSFISLALLN